VKKLLLSCYRAAPFFLVCALTLVSCADEDGEERRYNGPDAQTVTIGVVYPASQWDNDHYLREALDLAVHQVNDSGGILGKPLSLVVRDDRNDANTAQAIAETFSSSGITAVVGHWNSDVCYYVEDIYEERQIVMITPAATSIALFEQDYQYIYRIVANDQVYARALADFMEAEGIRRPAIFFTEDTYGKDLAWMVERELMKRYIPVVDRVTSVTAANVGELLRRWRAFGCDGLVLASSIMYVIEPIQRIRGAGVSMPFFSETFNIVDFHSLVGNYMENLFGIVYSLEDMDATFLADFNAAYGRVPDSYEVAGYEAVRLLANAMNAEGSTASAAIIRYLQNLRDYPSVMGAISYDAATHEFEGLRMRVKPYAEYEVR
jgi:branched-chain amino acid transport system substrate-binding protein